MSSRNQVTWESSNHSISHQNVVFESFSIGECKKEKFTQKIIGIPKFWLWNTIGTTHTNEEKVVVITMSKRYNEKRAALAQKALDKELDMGYGREDFDMNAAKDVRGAAMGEGEDELYEKKMSKAEKKAAAKAAREAKRKAKGLSGKKSKKEEEKKEDTKLSPEEAQKKIDAILNDPNATKEQKQEAALENLSREEIVVTYESRKTKMHANARNINVSGVTVTFHGKPLIEETNLVINYGNRYGFIGPNGSGKVSLA